MIYSPLHAFLVRIPMLESEVFGSTAEEAVVIEYTRSMKEVRQQKDKARTGAILNALLIANPKFVENLRDGKKEAKQYVEFTLLQYLIRMSTRTTPFGIFASVGIGTFSDGAAVRLDKHTTFRARADMSWISRLVSRLESENLPETSTLTMNSTAIEYAGRIFIEDSLPISIYDKNAPKSMRNTGPVGLILNELKDKEVMYKNLVDILVKRYKDREKVEALLHSLISESFIITDLRPPLTEPDPLRYLAARISDAGVKRHVESVLDSIDELNRAQHDNFRRNYEKITDNVRTITKETPDCILRAETALADKCITLPKAVGRNAAELAELMLSMSIFPEGLPRMRDYRDRFVEEYGYNGVVPLLVLLDENTGIGSPYKGDKWKVESSIAKMDPKAEEMLFNLVSISLKEGSQALKLSDKEVDVLKTWKPDYRTAPISMNLNINICSKDERSMNAGNYTLMVSPAGGNREALSSISRVADVIGHAAREYAADIVKAETELDRDETLVEMFSYPELRNISDLEIRPAFYKHAIFIDQIPSSKSQNRISLSDIYVGMENNGLCLYSRSLGRRIRVMHTTLLNDEMYPDISKFLIDVSNNHMCPTLNHFNWGKASRMPFLPRLEYKNLILSLARWRVSKDTLPRELNLDSTGSFISSVSAWRESWTVPRFVYLLEDYSTMLLIDLESDMHLKLLYHKITHIKENEALEIVEGYPYENGIRLRGRNGSYISEFIIPLVKNRADPQQRTVPKMLEGDAHFRKPMNWVFIKLYMKEELEDVFIAEELGNLASALGKAAGRSRWFFVRYADPQHHIRLRVETTAKSLDATLYKAYALSSRLVESRMISRFSIDTYVREVQRYGGEPGMKISEKLFWADSMTSADIISEAAKVGYRNMITLCAASADHMLGGMGMNLAERMAFYRLVAGRLDSKAGKEFGKNLEELMGAHKHKGQLHRIVSNASGKKADEALAEASRGLKTLFQRARQGSESEDILASYLHMHCNRLLGTKREEENEVYILLKRYSEILNLGKKGKKARSKS